MKIPVFKKIHRKKYIKYVKMRYKNLLLKYEDPLFFIHISKKQIIYTNTTTNDNTDLFFGQKSQLILEKLGKPIFKTKLGIYPNYQILVYEKYIAGIQVVFELHFFKNSLFFFNKTFYSSDHDFIEEMVNISCEKYQVPESNNLDDIKVVDELGNCLFISNHPNLSINFLAYKSESFNELIISAEKKMMLNKLKDQSIKVLHKNKE